MNVNEKIINCPRCLGKGFVSDEDIDRLDMSFFWASGDCLYCNKSGKVNQRVIDNIDVRELNIDNLINDNDNSLFKIEEGITFNNFEEFISKVSQGCSHHVFRGQSDYNYKLTSSISRKIEKPLTVYDKEEFLLKEKSVLTFFKARAKSTINSNIYNDWEWLALAQHYGISTRIIDWTENPLIALYFASINNPNKDGAIFLHHTTELIDIDQNKPFGSNLNGFIVAPYVTNRLASQSAIFSISSSPWNEFVSKQDNIIKCKLTKEFKAEMRNLLPILGINRRTVFIDLDSVAKDIDEASMIKICKSSNRGITFH